MGSLLVHCHGENWKSPTLSFRRSGKAKRTFQGTKRTFNPNRSPGGYGCCVLISKLIVVILNA